MRILIYSRDFLPKIGGLTLNVAHLAEGLAELGNEVVVVTVTPGRENENSRYRVVRNPGAFEYWKLMRWCEVFHQPNVSLRGLWPWILTRRPWVVSHHGWYCRSDGRIIWADRLKRRLIRYSHSIAVSRAIADDLDAASTVIENHYDDRTFRILPDADRRKDLLFVGRLVSDKGVDILLDALGRLSGEGLSPRLTIVGEGPEEPLLRRQSKELGLEHQVAFEGIRLGEDLVRSYNEHRILVVPSRYNEPFGIVALEGIACGCVVIASAGGGLPQAIGPCGVTFPNGDAAALAASIRDLLESASRVAELRTGADEHLKDHGLRAVVARYEAVMKRAAGRVE